MKKNVFPSTVLIATFSPWKKGKRLPINGNVEPMLDYFVPRTTRTVLVDQVYPGSDVVLPRIEVYQEGKAQPVKMPSLLVRWLVPLLRLVNTGGTHVSFKVRDFLSVVDWGLRDSTVFDLFIGFEAINALAGVLLRTIGRVKRVVYYVSDYSPDRYKAGWFNALYLWLDRQAAMRADVIWDVSPAMQPARVKAGLNAEKSAPVNIVPNALYPKQIRSLPVHTRKKHTLVFMGTLGVENGPDTAIAAMPHIRRRVGDAVLHIVGGGQDEQRLKHLARSLHVTDAVVFHGFVADREKVSATIRQFQVAVAPYVYIKGSARLYGDATKIRAYMAAGLPTITTRVPPLGVVIAEKGAGIITGDTPKALADAVVALFRDEKRYAAMCRAAIRFARNNTWEKEYQKAMKHLYK